eukprot:CAMPEP_0113823806 /NCGR_PEP_ID=MMETSP0328-20130328/2926_1 /TAXON_ID=39455 /ORGANISM="Alexandrium minutum" /LENGTH=92 /DNA_ID=CAMNT_0000791745 /DNA_START=71 /DNA_END=349 /DNA_ORIENTATION=+ /assembly_acc=CAM_ASM_000350
MAMHPWLEPAPGVNYGVIVGLQSFGCAICLLLAALQFVASQPGAEYPSLDWVKGSGWWILPAPFFPAVVYYILIWSVQRSRGKAETDKKKAE